MRVKEESKKAQRSKIKIMASNAITLWQVKEEKHESVLLVAWMLDTSERVISGLSHRVDGMTLF